MSLLQFRENINTECRIPFPILKIKALKIDANKNSLKQKVGCKNLKSCDYFKRKKDNLYFIEISDFHDQFVQLSKLSNTSKAAKDIKLEVRLKLSDSLLIHQNILRIFNVSAKNISLKNKSLLTVCLGNKSDVIIFSWLERELTKHYCPTHFNSIKIIPYTELVNIFKR